MVNNTKKVICIVVLCISFSSSCNPKNRFITINDEVTQMISTESNIEVGSMNQMDDSESEEKLQNNKIMNCIGDFPEFAYKIVDDYEEYSDLGDIYPLSPWEYVEDFQIDENKTNGVITYVSNQNSEELWFYSIDNSKLSNTRTYILYYPNEKRQIIVDSSTEVEGVWVDRLFSDSNGNIWGRNMWDPSLSYSMDQISILSKYNRDTKSFEIDQNSYKIPLVQNDDGFIDWVSFVIAPNDMIWFFIPYDGLYSYDTNTYTTIKQLIIPDVKVKNVTISANGDIYYLVWPDLKNDRTIFKYDPTNKKLVIYASVNYQTIGGANILFDNKDELWLGPISKIDAYGYQEILHPYFNKYSQKISSAKGEYWQSPTIIEQSSNGYLWFTKNRYTDTGTAWFDPKNGDGCWFTTFVNGIVEDNYGRIWFLAGNKLYYYDIDTNE